MPPLENHTPKDQAFHRFLDTHFTCPRCGAGDGPDGLYIDMKACPLEPDDEWSECEVIHAGDCCACQGCGWSGTARQVYNAAKKKCDYVVCPCCKGIGLVAKDEEAKK